MGNTFLASVVKHLSSFYIKGNSPFHIWEAISHGVAGIIRQSQHPLTELLA